MGGETDRPDWGDGGGSSGRAGAPHSEPKGDWTPVGSKGAHRYSGPLADLEHGEQQPSAELENVEQHEPANSLEVTAEERREVIDGIEERAAPPTEYADLSEDTRALFDEEGYEQVTAEIASAREHLTHEEYDDLAGAIDGMPRELNEKVLTALSTGSFANMQEFVEGVAQDLTAVQMGHLRRAISEMPSAIKDKIDI